MTSVSFFVFFSSPHQSYVSDVEDNEVEADGDYEDHDFEDES
jgi:hypothetical protein